MIKKGKKRLANRRKNGIMNVCGAVYVRNLVAGCELLTQNNEL
jgi:hypothetical protein